MLTSCLLGEMLTKKKYWTMIQRAPDIIDNDEDRYGDISGEDYYYSEDSNIVYEGEGEGEVAVHADEANFTMTRGYRFPQNRNDRAQPLPQPKD